MGFLLYTFLICVPLLVTAQRQQQFRCPQNDRQNWDELDFPDEWDCSRFYSCVNNVGFRMTCPAGTMFDTNKRNCDLEANVRCDGRPRPINIANRGGIAGNFAFLQIPQNLRRIGIPQCTTIQNTLNQMFAQLVQGATGTACQTGICNLPQIAVRCN